VTFERLQLTNEVRLVGQTLCTVYRATSPDGQAFEVLVAAISNRTPPPPATAPGCPLNLIALTTAMNTTIVPLARPRVLLMVFQAASGRIVANFAGERTEQHVSWLQQWVVAAEARKRVRLFIDADEGQLSFSPSLNAKALASVAAT
jgi:hypothetical protein